MWLRHCWLRIQKEFESKLECIMLLLIGRLKISYTWVKASVQMPDLLIKCGKLLCFYRMIHGRFLCLLCIEILRRIIFLLSRNSQPYNLQLAWNIFSVSVILFLTRGLEFNNRQQLFVFYLQTTWIGNLVVDIEITSEIYSRNILRNTYL